MQEIMIKVYLDWNVMSGMKNNHFQELNDIIFNKEKFLLLYSTSHIGDIFASIKDHSEEEQKLVQEDLDYITHLTDNLCLVNNGKEVVLSDYEPGELLDDRIKEAPIFEDLSIDNLFKSIEGDDSFNGIVTSLKNLISSIPLDDAFKEAFENPESAAMLDKMFPGLKEDQTMTGFFKSFGKMFQNLNETEDYKDLRNMVQQIGVNSGHFNENKNPFEVIDNAYKKTGIENFEPDKYFKKGKNAPEWFDEITNEYIKLDMHGFKADKVKVTDKEKNTFKNTTEDASHSAFASICSFYLTNDDKNYHKTKAVYNKLSINTKVLKPDEFIDYYINYLNVHLLNDHLKSLFEIFTKPIFHNIDDDEGNYFGKVAYPNEYFFNFFNKIWVSSHEEGYFYFTLSTLPPNPNKTYTAYQEIKTLIRMFFEIFGPDENKMGMFDITEIQDEIWIGRHWQTNIGEIKIVRLKGWFQLYYNNEKVKENETASNTRL
jgi:hypothetical protein